MGYPSAKLLKTLPAREREADSGRIVIALTGNPYYKQRGVAAGATLALAVRRLHLGKAFHVGLNDWYLAPAGARADVIVKVRHGIVYEIGLVNRHLTTGRKATRLFLTSFPHVGVAA